VGRDRDIQCQAISQRIAWIIRGRAVPGFKSKEVPSRFALELRVVDGLFGPRPVQKESPVMKRLAGAELSRERVSNRGSDARLDGPHGEPDEVQQQSLHGKQPHGSLAGNSTAANLVLIYNPALGSGAGGYDEHFYSNGGLAGVGWRKVGAVPANTNQAGRHCPGPREAIYFQRSTFRGKLQLGYFPSRLQTHKR